MIDFVIVLTAVCVQCSVFTVLQDVPDLHLRSLLMSNSIVRKSVMWSEITHRRGAQGERSEA